MMVDGGTSLESLARIKEAIVLHGGVLTSMVVWNDFKAYTVHNVSSCRGNHTRCHHLQHTKTAPHGPISLSRAACCVLLWLE